MRESRARVVVALCEQRSGRFDRACICGACAQLRREAEAASRFRSLTEREMRQAA